MGEARQRRLRAGQAGGQVRVRAWQRRQELQRVVLVCGQRRLRKGLPLGRLAEHVPRAEELRQQRLLQVASGPQACRTEAGRAHPSQLGEPGKLGEAGVNPECTFYFGVLNIEPPIVLVKIEPAAVNLVLSAIRIPSCTTEI